MSEARLPGVLAHDVHDVRGDDGLVVLPLLLLAEAQQVLDHRHQEPLLVLGQKGEILVKSRLKTPQ